MLKDLVEDAVVGDVNTVDAPTEKGKKLPLKECIFTTKGMEKSEIREAVFKLGVYQEGDKVTVITWIVCAILVVTI